MAVRKVKCNTLAESLADAHREEKQFIVRADENLSAFVELGLAIPRCGDCA